MTPEKAAELTHYCECDYWVGNSADEKWQAKLWQGSRYYYGHGKTCLAAVLMAHRNAKHNRKGD